ncbi:Ankyrin-3 [Araneus ventricosus]|uniref:Alpha-latrotoxin n=1 Tax=Araneus ventricosus TaxID=182803 RepID=A0A4Y2MS34_ARAVE|nr:Ankyrin-3 [Araneus ventricosus]
MGVYEILKDDEVSSITINSRQDLLLKFKKLDEVSAKDFYIDILKAVNDFISGNKTQPLEHLNWLLNKIGKYANEQNLRHYFESAKTCLHNFNPIIFACRSKAIDSLRHILMDKKKTLYKLSCKIHNKIILPKDDDEFHHSAFYYAVRSNIIDLLSILITKWPNRYLDENSEELDCVLSKSYRELKLRNVLLSKEMELYVQTQIFNIRFFHKNPKDISSGKSMDHTQRRIKLVIENIELIKSIYWDSDPDEEFILLAEFIAKNIHVLKSDLKSTYDKLPWEEIEFCLAIFIECCKNNFEANLIYNSVLKKERLLLYLEKFSNILESEKESIANNSMKKLGKKLDLKRHTVVENIIKSNSSLQNLYADFQQVRDFCSLETIKNYTNLAVSADVSTVEGKLLIIRALQVTGEHIKNKLYSPKLSSTTAHLLLSSLPLYTRDVIEKLRNCLSHKNYLMVRSEIENKAYSFFQDMQSDISNMNRNVTEVLTKIKRGQMKILLLKLKQYKYWRDIKDLLGTYSFTFESITAEIKKLGPDALIKNDVERLKEMLLNFLERTGEKTALENSLFEQIKRMIQTEEDEYVAESEEISLIIQKLCEVADFSQHVDLDDACDFDLRSINLEISDVSNATLSTLILELVRELVYSAIRRTEPENIELLQIGFKIFHLIDFEMDKVKWINEYTAVLHKQKQKKMYSKDVEVLKVLSSKISFLNTVLKENNLIYNLDHLLKSNLIINFHNNRKLQTVIEMLVLDISSLLEDSFTHNNFFLDNDYILQTGLNLRNNLAHANILINDLSPMASLQILLNAQNLATENFANNSKKIGQVQKCDSQELETTHIKNLNIIRNQKALFLALSEGNMENVRVCVGEGADIFGRDLKSTSCLHFSSKAPNIEALKYCLKQGLDINCTDFKNRTALHIAAKFNRLKIVDFLLNKSVSVNRNDAQGITPLHIAAENNSQEIVKSLLKHKSHASNNVFRFPPLHYAIFKGNIEAAKVLLENETNVDKIKGYGGSTALHTAAGKGDPYLVRLLLKKKASIYSRDDFENTPLHYAALKSHLNAVKILVLEGADIKARNIVGNTPLHGAALSGNKKIVRFLLHNTANISAKNHLLSIPLHCAVRNGHVAIAKIFLRMDSTLSNAKNGFGHTPLHSAACYGHEKLVNLLLKFNAIIDSQDNNDATALHISVNNGHLDVVKSLVESGANIEAIGTSKNCKPLHLASEQGHFHILEFLIYKGADIHSRGGHVQSTSLEIAAMKRHKDIVKLLITKGANFQETYKFGIYPLFHLTILNALSELILVENISMSLCVDDFGPLLQLAAACGDESFITFCLKLGSNVNSRNESGLTALHLAALNNRKDIVTFLLDSGADIDIKDDEGATALCFAARGNGTETVEVLINKQGEDIMSAIDDRNKSLFYAAESGHDDIVNMLFLNCKFNIDSLQKTYPFLHSASRFGHRKVVETLLGNGFEIDARWDNYTPLLYAVINNHCEIARLLISKGANVNAQNGEGMTALHWIAERDNVEMLQILLNGGADVSIRDKTNRSVTEIAVNSNRLEIAKILLQRKDIDINMKGNKGFTLLHISAEIGSLEITKHLTLKGANKIAKDMNGSKPIHVAAVKGHKDIVEFYLDKNVNVNDLGHRNFTPLHFAALDGKINVCEYLIEIGADVNAFADNDMTPIHLAAVNDNEEVFRILLHNGAYYNACDTSSSSQLSDTETKSVVFLLKVIEKLFIAVQNNNPSEVELQLKEAGCHPKFSIVNAKCVKCETPLLYASREGYEEIVEILLKFKANPNVCDKHKLMPLHYAAKCSHLKVVKALLFSGAMYNELCFNGNSPLEYATDQTIVNLLRFANNVFTKIEDNNNSVLKDLKDIKNEEFSKLMLRAKDRNGNTLVAAAILNDFSESEKLKELFQDDVIHHLKSAEVFIKQQNLEAPGKLKTVLDRRIEIYGQENPATLDVLEKLARVLINLQKDVEALDLLQEIYRKRKNIFNEYHKETLTIKFLMALIFHRQGKQAEAYDFLKEVLKHKILFKKNYLDILYSEMKMSLILAEMGDFVEALKMSNNVLDISTNEHGSYHEITLRAQDNTAMILEMQGNFSKAKEIFEQIYNIRKNRLPTYHTEVLRSRSSIAKLLYKMKKYDESLRIYKDIQKISKCHYPPNQVCVLSTESDIARIFLAQGMTIKALKIFLALESKISEFEEDHFLVKRNKSDIESVLLRLKFIDYEWLVEKIRNELKLEETEKLKYLEVDINSQNEKGRTALHIAVDNGEREKINSLLEKGADIFMVTKDGKTALHFASAKGYNDIAEMILNHAERRNLLCAKNLINVTDSTLSTALHLVSNVTAAKCLLKHGAIYNAKNDLGQTPLDLAGDEKILGLLKTVDELFNAVRNGSHNVIRELDELDSEEALAAMNARNCQDHCLLQIAIANQRNDLAREIGNCLKKKVYK